MLRLMFLGTAAVVAGLAIGWVVVPAERPTAPSARAPIDIVAAHTFRTAPPSTPTVTLTAPADLPEATSEASGSGRVAKKRKQLKDKLAAAASGKPGVRCVDGDDDDDEC